MPKIAYIDRRFKPETLNIIESANRIIDDYRSKGFDLTLRQLYYQFIARDLFPSTWIDPKYNARHGLDEDTKNTQKNYKRLGSILNDARLAGYVDWSAIEDRARNLAGGQYGWASGRDYVDWAVDSSGFQMDRWKDQPSHLEVWVEKEALADVIERACRAHGIPYMPCKGYMSQSEMWRAARRFHAKTSAGKDVVLIHLGDHDPSGVDMTRDIDDRLRMFRGLCRVRRIALNMDQIEEQQPPPNPAKITDSRAEGYIEKFGDDSWELDALEPQYMIDLIREVTAEHIDQDAWEEILEREAEERAKIDAALSNIDWDALD